MTPYRRVYIDLLPDGADARTATWIVERKTVFAWQAEFLQKQKIFEICVRDSSVTRDLLKDQATVLPVTWSAEAPDPVQDLVVPIHWVMDKIGFKNAYQKKQSLQKALLWQIRSEKDLGAACSEWVRNDWLPFHTDYIKHAAHRLADWAYRTPLTPNQLTTGTLLCALGVFTMLFTDAPFWHWIAPPLIIFAVVLDFADGRLARLKNAGSRFGAYWDSTVGDLTEDLCYLGIIAYMYRYDFLLGFYAPLIGVAYFFGKYQAYLSLVYLNNTIHAPVLKSGQELSAPLSNSNSLARIFVVFEFTVVRYHFLALCLLFRRPEVALVFYAIHFNLRWILRVSLECWRYSRGLNR